MFSSRRAEQRQSVLPASIAVGFCLVLFYLSAPARPSQRLPDPKVLPDTMAATAVADAEAVEATEATQTIETSAFTVDLAVDCKANLGESPIWDGASQLLYFIDINGKEIYTYDPATGKSSKCGTHGNLIGTIVPRAAGGLVAALEDTIELVNPANGAWGPTIARVPEGSGGPGFRFNDGKCDPQGRLWAGIMNKNWRDPEQSKGSFFLLSPDIAQGLAVQVDNVTLSNGMTWTPDGKGMYYIDSFSQTVDLFDFDPTTGSISNRRTVIRIPQEEGIPDGMTIDSQGKLWIVLGESGAVFRYNPETGEQMLRVPLPVKRPTACTFGGPDLGDLYVTTREEPGENPSPHAGAVFRVRVPGVRGLSPAHPFLGASQFPIDTFGDR